MPTSLELQLKAECNDVKLIAYTNARVQGFNQCMRKLLWEDNIANEYNQFEFLTGYENLSTTVLSFTILWTM